MRPRDAASLIVVRRDADAPRLLMGLRGSRARFVPDAYVFPGGGLEPHDRLPHPGPDLHPEVAIRAQAGKRRLDPHVLARAAVRETFEETGLAVGHAGFRPGTAPALNGADPWRAFRTRDIAPALDRLDLVARAITPTASPIRFHVRFFMVEADYAHGVLAGDGELLELGWFTVEEALALPVIDVTQFVIEEAGRLVRARPRLDRPRPFWHYRRGRARIDYF